MKSIVIHPRLKRRLEEACLPIQPDEALPYLVFGFVSWFIIAMSAQSLSSLPVNPRLLSEQLVMGLFLICYQLIWARQVQSPVIGKWSIPIATLLWATINLWLLIAAQELPFWSVVPSLFFVCAGIFTWSDRRELNISYASLAAIITVTFVVITTAGLLLIDPGFEQTFAGMLFYCGAIIWMLASLSRDTRAAKRLLSDALTNPSAATVNAGLDQFNRMDRKRFREVSIYGLIGVLIPLAIRWFATFFDLPGNLWGEGNIIAAGYLPTTVVAMTIFAVFLYRASHSPRARILIYAALALSLPAMVPLAPVVAIAVSVLIAVAGIMTLGRTGLIFSPTVLIGTSVLSCFFDPDNAHLFTAMSMTSMLALLAITPLIRGYLRQRAAFALLADGTDISEDSDGTLLARPIFELTPKAAGIGATLITFGQIIGFMIAGPLVDQQTRQTNTIAQVESLAQDIKDELSLVEIALAGFAQSARQRDETRGENSSENSDEGLDRIGMVELTDHQSDLIKAVIMVDGDRLQTLASTASGQFHLDRQSLRRALASRTENLAGIQRSSLTFIPLYDQNAERLVYAARGIKDAETGEYSGHLGAVLSLDKLLGQDASEIHHYGYAFDVELQRYGSDESNFRFTSDSWKPDFARTAPELKTYLGNTPLVLRAHETDESLPLLIVLLLHILEAAILAGCFGITAYQVAHQRREAELVLDANRAILEADRQRELAAASNSANLAKSRFLANMSHEIRTPLNAIIASVSLLQRPADSSELADTLDAIHSAGSSLMMLVNDVLDISKIEAGELLVEHRDFSLNALLDQIKQIMQTTAQTKSVELTIARLPETMESRLNGDETHLRQILLNLLSNALKFTSQGHVSLTIAVVDPKQGEDIRLQFTVADSGIGMSEEYLSNLFEPFTQADESTRREYGGTGLGMALVKQLVETCNGTISVRSTRGQGTTFVVEMPYANAASTEPQSPSATDQERTLTLDGARILLVDDIPTNLKIARKLLERAGASIDTATNGLEALQALEANPDLYQAVVTDLQMPVMDGYEACRRIRANPIIADMPIIALTAAATNSDRDAALAAGADAYETKPVQIERLAKTIASRLRPARV